MSVYYILRDNLVSNGQKKFGSVMYIYNIIKVHSLSGVGKITGTTVVLFVNSLSSLWNNTCLLCVLNGIKFL